MKKNCKYLFIIFLVLIFVIGGVVGALSSDFAMQKAKEITAETVSNEIDLKCDIGNVNVESLGKIVVHDVNLYDKNGDLMLKVPQIEVTPSIMSAIFNTNAIIETITARSPTLYLTARENGELNLSDITPKSDEKSSFKSSIIVQDGAIYGDYKGKKLKLTNVNAKADIDGEEISYNADLKSFDAAFIIGGFHGNTDEININGKNIDLANYKEFLSLLKEQNILTDDVSIMGGVIPHLTVNLDIDGGDVKFGGNAELKDGHIKVFDTIVNEICGKAAFKKQKLLVDLSALANEQNAKVSGYVDFSDTPTMNLAVKSDGFDINEVISTVPLKGKIEVLGNISGTFDHPLVSAHLKQADGELDGIILKDTEVKARIIGKKVVVDDAKTKIFDGEVIASGFLDTDDLSFIVHTKGKNLRCEYAANFIPNISGLYGNASFDLNVHGKSDDLKNLSVYGIIGGENLNYQSIGVSSLGGSFYGNGGELNIDWASVKLANNGGTLGIEGKILPDVNNINLALYGTGIDFKNLSVFVPAFKGDGAFDVTATLVGDMLMPDVNLRINSVFGSLFGQEYDSMRTVLSGNPSLFNIDEFIFLKDGKNYWQVLGFFGITGEKPINIAVKTDGARLEKMINLFLPQAKLTGNLTNTVKIGGSLSNPTASGHLDITPGSVNGMLVQSAGFDYRFNDDILTIDSADIKMPLLDGNVKGSVNLKTKELNFDVICSDVDMMRLRHKFPYDVTGHGELIGKIFGTTDNPAGTAVIKADNLVFNTVPLTNVRGEANFKDNVLTVTDLGATSQKGAFLANIFADIKNDKISANCIIDNMDIESMALLSNSKSKHLKGTFTAKAVTTGKLKEPETRVTGVIPKGTLAGYDIRDVAVAINMNAKSFEIESFKGFEGENGEIDGSLSISPDGGMKGFVTGKNIDFGMFTKLGNIDAKVIGKADITSTFRGDFHNPASDITLEVRNGGIQGSTFDTLTGNLSFDSKGLEIKELVVKKTVGEKNYSASAKGIVPVQAVIDSDERSASWQENPQNSMDLTLQLDNANLSLIPALSKAVEWAEGETDGTIKLTGSIKQPQIHGILKVADGVIKIKALRKPITNINLNLIGKGRDIVLENFSGNLGSGNYLGKGSVHIENDDSLRYNFDLDLNALQVNSEYYEGLLSGKLNLTQDYTGRPGYRRLVPKVSGNISSEYAQIVVPIIPESDTPTPEVLLNLDLNFGKRVHLYEAQLYDMYFSGSAHFGGSTKHPASSGTIEVKRGGTIKISHNTFRIHSAEVIFNQRGTYLPSIRFLANTHVGKTKIYVALMGPLGTDKIKPYLTSSPSMSQTEIIRLLTLGTDYQKDSNGTDEVKGILMAGLQMTVLSGVERELKKGLSLDAFSLAHGSGSTFPRHREKDDYYSLTMEKYIGEKWLLRYNHGLGTGTGNYLLGVTYELNDRSGIILEHVDGANIVGIEGRIRF